MYLVLHEVSKNIVDQVGELGYFLIRPAKDDLNMSIVAYGIVDEISILRVSLQGRN
jgi:hypothetical protein